MSGSTAGDDSTSTRVVRLVAEREDVDTVRLDPPLNDVVDPDALDTLFTDAEAPCCVCFEYCGYTVHVASDGTVEVTARAGEQSRVADESSCCPPLREDRDS